MKFILNAMFLGSHSGSKENGEIYYYGSFLEKDSHKTINLYFDNNDLLKNFESDKWYQIPVELYFSSVTTNNNQRVIVLKLRPDKEAMK